MDDTELTELKDKMSSLEAEHKRLCLLLRAQDMGLILQPERVYYGFLGFKYRDICPKCKKELSAPIFRAGFELYKHDCGYEYVLGRAGWVGD